MSFANPVPWWAFILITAALALVAYQAYARLVIPVTSRQRALLIGLRFLTLMLLVIFLLQPVRIEPAAGVRDAIVPVLVDGSRSMRLGDAAGGPFDGTQGRPRIEAAAAIVRDRLLPELGKQFQVEVLTFGDALAPADPSRLVAEGRHSDLIGALRAVQTRYRGRAMAGIVLVSDGGDTGGRDALAAIGGSTPVYAVGVGAARGRRDREVLNLTAGEAAFADSLVEVNASIVSHGFGAAPAQVRLLENGQPTQVRRVTPAADGSPVHEVFSVSPKREAATLYTVEIASEASELALENNARSVLVKPPGRRRRVLLVEGAPGYEHSFIKRTLMLERGLEVDSVVRKGVNERGEDTFYIQAAASRSPALVTGYPTTREALFAYDAIIFGNVEADFFKLDQLAATRDFVAERGGGLLALGARSFARGTLVGTALEEVLPVDLLDRGGAVRVSASTSKEPNRLVLTPDGEQHPVTRVGGSAEEARKRWAAAPPLASTSPLGAPRPGAAVLAVTSGPGGSPRPLIAVQRYGRGRSMVFAGEASWRWRMLLPAEDRTYETFWRQAARWLATMAPDPVMVSATGGATPGDTITVGIEAHDKAFAPVRDATVRLQVSGPGVSTEQSATLADATSGRYATTVRAAQAGVYRLRAEARRGAATLGASEEWMLVGGADPEFTDPRLNEEVLRRIALATGGEYLPPEHADRVVGLLGSRAPDQAPPVRHDVWNTGWVFLIVATLLSAEWVVRRRIGLR